MVNLSKQSLKADQRPTRCSPLDDASKPSPIFSNNLLAFSGRFWYSVLYVYLPTPIFCLWYSHYFVAREKPGFKPLYIIVGILIKRGSSVALPAATIVLYTIEADKLQIEQRCKRFKTTRFLNEILPSVSPSPLKSGSLDFYSRDSNNFTRLVSLEGKIRRSQ